jgi:hypothetical protein
MKIISYAWTTPAILARRKTCTRRHWNDDYAGRFKAGELLAGYNRNPRFHGNQIAVVQLTMKPYKEPLAHVPDSDWEAEGFAYLTEIGATVNGKKPQEVWDMWKQSLDEEWVVRFEIVELIMRGPFYSVPRVALSTWGRQEERKDG